MATSGQLKANRANGRLSKGPKTREGKARSSRNALRHGLSIPILAVSQLSKPAEQLAREIAVDDRSDIVLVHARRVAEAQIDLDRIRKARHELLLLMEGSGSLAVGAALHAHLGMLKRLDRYERRVLSRRRKAIRDYDCATIIERIRFKSNQ